MPRKFLQWLVVAASFFLLLVAVSLVVSYLFYAKSPRLEPFLGISSAWSEAFFIVGMAVIIATTVVSLFGATKGNLELKSPGITVKGPSGPVTLWIAVLFAVIIAFYAVSTIASEEPDRTRLQSCLVEPNCRVAVHLGQQSSSLTDFKANPGIERFTSAKCDDVRLQRTPYSTIATSRRLNAVATSESLLNTELHSCLFAADATCVTAVSLEASREYILTDCLRVTSFSSLQFIGFIEESGRND